MLCTLCQHGVTAKAGGKPTDATWPCGCGESNCKHIRVCQCGRAKPQRPALGDYLGLGGELHTTIHTAHGLVEPDVWLVEDNRGEDFRVVRYPEFDTEERSAWKLAEVTMHVVYREQDSGEWQEIYRTPDKGKADAEAEKMSAKGRIRTKVVPKTIQQRP